MTETRLYVKNESINLSKKMSDKGCVIPINVINNIKMTCTDGLINQIKILYFYELSNKHKNILDKIHNQWFINNNIYTEIEKKKSYHYACISIGNKHIIKTNDYNRTYCNGQLCTSMHAEHNVVHHCHGDDRNKKKLNKNNMLIVIRYDKLGNKRNSRPCAHCMFIIKKSNIKKILYSNDNDTYCLECL